MAYRVPSCRSLEELGPAVAAIGHYNPRTDPAVIDVNAEQALAWLAKGALPTDTVRSLLKKAGVLGKRPA